MEDVNNFTSSNTVKYKSLCQLENVIVIAENAIVAHYETILRTFIKYFFYEEKEITNKVSYYGCSVLYESPNKFKIRNIVEIIGVYVDPAVSVPILKKLIDELDPSATKSLTACLVWEIFFLFLCNNSNITI